MKNEELDELQEKEEKFFVSSVEGFWSIQDLVVSDNLFCSEHVRVRAAFNVQ